MSGGLMQLVAYGAQDVYLSGNPQITFFKVVYRRHTNFAVEPIQQTWNGSIDFGRQVTCNINRNGDLITNMYIAVQLNAVTNIDKPWGYVRRLGHALVQSCKIEIGGSQIDQHYGDWLNIWYELTHKAGQQKGYGKMIGDVSELTTVSTNDKPLYQMYIPLQFWFNRNNGLALPLIALQYHDVRVTVNFRSLADCINWETDYPTNLNNLMKDSYLLIDYVYLDSEERKRFAQASHEYLIEQLQFTGSETITGNSNKIRLNFNHPCKYLVWAPQLERYTTRKQWISYAFNGDWSAAKDRFAKILFAVSLNGFSYAPGSPATKTVIKVSNGDMATKVGDLIEGNTNASLSSALGKMLAKFEIKMVAQSTATATTSSTSPTGVITPASDALPEITNSCSTDSELFTAVLNNMIVISNNLTMQDISRTVSDIKDLLFAAGVNVSGTTINSHVLRFLESASLNVVDYTNYGNFVDGSDNPVVNAKLQLNGHDRFQARDGQYFNYVQPFQHFSNTPADGINVYSFALKAEDHQPSGTCNFSRIDNATLNVDFGVSNNFSSDWQKNWGNGSSSLLNIYTMNYNVLRVMSGMAGTAYSN